MDADGSATAAEAPQPTRQQDRPAREVLAFNDAALDAAMIPAVRRELPGLAEALDAAAMGPRLAGLLGDGSGLHGCSVAGQLYLPGAGCTVRYTVELDRAGSGEPTSHAVSGRVLPAELNAVDWLRERLQPLAAGAAERLDLAGFGQPVAAVEPLNMVLHAFPIDPELPGVLAATDPDGALDLVRAAVPEATACRVELVEFGGRGRCVLRYLLDTGGGDGEEPATTALIGRVHAGELGAAGREAAGALAGALGDAFAVERVRAYHPGPRLSLVSWVPGRPRVLELLEAGAGQGRDGLDADLATCARLAAAVHAAEVGVGAERTVGSELHALRGELLGVGGRAPALGVRLSRWLAQVEAAAAASAPLALAPAHGALTPATVLFEGDRCGLINLDGVCLAEPALDLGHFLAHLRVAAAAAGRGQDADRLGAHILGAYAKAAGVDREWLGVRTALYEALSLTRVAMRRWAALEPVGVAQVLRLMTERRSPVPETAR